MKYEIMWYNGRTCNHLLKNEQEGMFSAYLSLDKSFSIVGKFVEIESLTPRPVTYFANNVTLLDEETEVN